MKRVLLATASLLLSVTTMAQLPVSTAPSNKKVVLEEFTGIHCVFCPDGHKIAAGIHDANPNDVFLINIHTGGYAVPQAGEPDFRTAFGSLLAGQSGLTGYPSGTVNRHIFSGGITAMGRGSWGTSASTILGESSYVNVALEADIDLATRVMTVDLEAYFTADGASSMNINVVVTQNNVEGPQTGGSTYNPDNILPNGNYNHQHMLRHMITGQWGDVITTTTSGTKVTKQYIWTIPADIEGVPLELGDLQVIGFIVEGQQEIISGAEGTISFAAPAGTTIVDLSTKDSMVPPNNSCDVFITPKVTVENMETNATSGYELSYSLDGNTPVTMSITDALNGGSSANHSFPEVKLDAGAHMIEYNVVLAPGAPEVEIVTGNNKSSSPAFNSVSFEANALPVTEDFESTVATELPEGTYVSTGMTLFHTVNMDFLSQTSTSGSDPVGGSALSDNSILWFFWDNAAGTYGSYYLDKLDLTNQKNATLTFDHAYTPWKGTNDKLEVFVSIDCGDTWTSVWSKSGTTLKTADEVNENQIFFSPSSTEWVNNSIDLSAYFNHHLLVKFTGTSDYGDCLYVDNISLNGTTTGVQDLFASEDVSIFPNPAINTTTLSLTSTEAQVVTVNVTDVAGRIVTQINNQILKAGVNSIEINTSSLTNGVYFVNVSSEAKSSIVRLVIQK